MFGFADASNSPFPPSFFPSLLRMYVPLLDMLVDHSMAAYRAHDLDAVQADPAPATHGEKRPLGWD